MKNTLLFIFLLSSWPGFSQIKKNDLYLYLSSEGTAILNQSGYHNYNNYSLNSLKLGIGKFITDNSAVGIQLLGTYNANETSNNNNYSMGIGALYWYVYPLGDNWGLSWNNDLNYRQGEATYSNLNSTFYEVKGNAPAGLYCQLFNRLAITTSLNLLGFSGKREYSDKSVNTFGDYYLVKEFKLTGLLPGSFNLSAIQISLTYFIKKGNKQ